MTKKETSSGQAVDLRKQAKEIARKKTERTQEKMEAMQSEEMRQTLHELRVHQVELEMQNEELHRIQVELDASRERYFDLYDLAPVGYITVSKQGLILEANLTAATMLGVTRSTLSKPQLTRFIIKEDQEIYYRHRKQLFETGEPQKCELRLVRKDGTAYWALLDATVAQDADGVPVCRVVLSDITARKKVEKENQLNEMRLRKLVDILQHPSETIQDFLDYALDQAIQLTGSKIGYIYHYHEDRKEFVLNTWSKEVMSECTVANPLTCYELDKTGIWGEAVRQRKPIIINNFQASHPLKKGYPEGHVQLLKFITVPIFKGDSIAGVVGLANKDTDYEETDVLQVSLLMEVVWKITERKRAEDALRDSELKYRSLVECSSDAIFCVDEKGEYKFLNHLFSSTFGKTPDYFIGKTFWDIYPKVHADQRYEVTKRVFQTGESESVEVEVPLPDKTLYFYATANPIKDEAGKVILVMTHATNITERKQAEEAIRSEKRKLDVLLTSIPYGIYIVNRTCDIEYVNPIIEQEFGAVKGRKCYKYFHDRNEICPWCKNDEVFAGKSVRWEWWSFKNNKTYDLYDTPLVNDDGTISKLEIFVDITDRKLAEKEKAKLEAQLFQSQKMQAIGTLAGGIAHDFNNILSVIIGYTELARDRSQKENYEQYLQETLKGAERARNLVKQILTFSRQDDHEKKPLDIKVLLKEAIKFLRASIPTTIEIDQQLTEETCNILADPTQIHQIIMNLCTNASHAMKETGGTMKIELSNIELAKDEIPNHPELQQGHYVKLTVSDTGHGIDPDNIHRIFDPFFTTKSVDEGTGLGLSVVYGIVKNHGGIINVTSKLDEGATFNVYLPRIIQDVMTNVTSTKAIIGGTERILFVDDEPELVDIGTRMLTSLGYDVTGVLSSVEALNMVSTEPQRFDLVITDMTLPKMTGIVLARKILKICPDIPIILCSGIRESDTADQVKSLGVRAYIMKPLTKGELARVIRDTLDDHAKSIS